MRAARVARAADLQGRVRPDVAFTRRKAVVFVDGCFWHVCPVHASYPRDNAEFWSRKLARNVERDCAQEAALVAEGWTVVRIWEHEPMQDAAGSIAALVSGVSAG